MSEPVQKVAGNEGRTLIRKRMSDGGEFIVGYLGTDGVIDQARRGDGQAVGRVDAERRVFRRTTHDERELGYFTPHGRVHSHGLFEGGAIGWVEPDGVVVQAGLIMGEEEVGSCEGSQFLAAGAALLLLLLPDDAEANRSEAQRRP